MVTRKSNWPQLLSEYIASRKRMPFEWGKNDCLTFVANGVEHLTGEPFYASFESYNSEEAAQKMLEKHGGVVGIIIKCLGKGHLNFRTAQRGDVAIVRMPEISAALVDDSGQYLVAISQTGGLIRIHISKALRIWSY